MMGSLFAMSVAALLVVDYDYLLLLYIIYTLHIYNSQIHRATSLEQILGGSIGPT